jgi:hypothetical protein
MSKKSNGAIRGLTSKRRGNSTYRYGSRETIDAHAWVQWRVKRCGKEIGDFRLARVPRVLL